MIEVQEEEPYPDQLEVQTYAVTRVKKKRAVEEELAESEANLHDAQPRTNWDKEKRTVQKVSR